MKRLYWLSLLAVLALAFSWVPVAAKVAETDGAAPALAEAKSDWFIIEFEAPSLAAYAKSGAGTASLMFAGGKLDASAPASRAYINRLKAQQALFSAELARVIPNARVGRGYQIVLNALAVELPDADLKTLQKVWSLPGVKAVHPQRIYTVQMDYSLPLVNAPALWAQLGGREVAGEGVKVAVIDTGINPKHAMFDGTGWSYPSAGTWPKGYCADNPDFCNGKIIAARYYTPTFAVNVGEVLSPEDRDGHGSHTAGTAAGNVVTATYGADVTVISGVAPGAWLMVYKGLFHNVEGTTASGSDIMLIAAIEDAIADGADVVNNSWGSTALMPGGDPLTTAYEAAADAGLVVVFSTGNAGPGYNTTGAPSSPKFIEVGATTTSRAYYNTINVTAPEPVPDELQSFPGNQFSDIAPSAMPDGPIGPLPYIPCNLQGKPDLTLPGVTPGITQTAPYDKGWIALIPRGQFYFSEKLDNAIAQGASAVVMYTDQRTWKDRFTASGRAIYTVMIARELGLAARDWWVQNPHEAYIQIGYPVSPWVVEQEDVIANFSSRGPDLRLQIKPDVVAPGVNILSAIWDGTYEPYNGTSMAAPHVTGAAALLKALHPTWTPTQIKSALMSTANQLIFDTDGTTFANTMTRGAGRIDLSKAGDPGLTFDPPSYSFGMVPQGTSAKAIIAAWEVAGITETYQISVQELVADTGNVAVTVSPAILEMAPGSTALFTITVEVGAEATVQDLEGNIIISGTKHLAHVPYWLRVYEDTGAEVLLVDFDESEASASGFTTIYGTPFGDYTYYYTSTLEALGIQYDYWNVWDLLSPPRAVLDQYDKVIVYSGDYGGLLIRGGRAYFGDELDANDFRNYLAAGGKLLFSGQEALGDYYYRYFGYGNIDPLAPYMRGASSEPLQDGVFPDVPPKPSAAGIEEYNPFLKDMILDLSPTGDGAGNQYAVDELQWAYYSDLDTRPLFEIANTVGGAVENGYIGTRSSYEPSLERVIDPKGELPAPVLWRVVFLSFGLEGVNSDTGYTTREQLLGALVNWLDDQVAVSFNASSYHVPRAFGLAEFEATLTSSKGAKAVYYRWDFGDGSAKEVTLEPTVTHQYFRNGTYYARVEAMDEYGHVAVSAPVTVIVGPRVFLPLVLR